MAAAPGYFCRRIFIGLTIGIAFFFDITIGISFALELCITQRLTKLIQIAERIGFSFGVAIGI